jgi:CheY-like chemotaxis protein
MLVDDEVFNLKAMSII